MSMTAENLSQCESLIESQEYGLQISQPLSQYELAGVWVRPASTDVHVDDEGPNDIEPMLPVEYICPDVTRKDKPDFFRQVKVNTSKAEGRGGVYYTVRCWWRDPKHRGLPSQAPSNREWIDDLGEVHTIPPVGWFVRCSPPRLPTTRTGTTTKASSKKRARASMVAVDAIVERQSKQHGITRGSSGGQQSYASSVVTDDMKEEQKEEQKEQASQQTTTYAQMEEEGATVEQPTGTDDVPTQEPHFTQLFSDGQKSGEGGSHCLVATDTENLFRGEGEIVLTTAATRQSSVENDPDATQRDDSDDEPVATLTQTQQPTLTQNNF